MVVVDGGKKDGMLSKGKKKWDVLRWELSIDEKIHETQMMEKEMEWVEEGMTMLDGTKVF
jgi:hypothetical protein